MKSKVYTKKVSICERCGKTELGDMHTFFYGRWTGSTRDALSKTSHYIVAGSVTSFICDRCRWRGVLSSLQVWIAVAGMVIVIYGIIDMYIGKPEFGRMMLSASLPVLLLCFLLIWFSGWIVGVEPFDFWENAGAKQAIKAHRKALEAQGFNLFLTADQYKKRTKA